MKKKEKEFYNEYIFVYWNKFILMFSRQLLGAHSQVYNNIYIYRY